MKIFRHNNKKGQTIASALVSGGDDLHPQAQAATEAEPTRSQERSQTEPETSKVATKGVDTKVIKPEVTKPTVSDLDESNDSVTQVQTNSKQIADLQTKMQGLSKKYRDLRSQLKVKMFTQRDLFANQIGEQNRNLSKLKQNLANLKKQIAAIQTRDDTKLLTQQADVNKQIPAAKSMIRDIEQRLQETNQSINHYEQDLSTIQDRMAESKAKENQLSEAIKGEDNLVKLLALVDANKQKALELVNEQKQLSEKQNDVQIKLADAKRLVKTSQNSLDQKQSELTALQRQVSQLQQQIETARRQRAQQQAALATQGNKLTKQIDQTNITINGLQNNFNEINTKLKRFLVRIFSFRTFILPVIAITWSY